MGRAPADLEASIKDNGFTRPGLGVTVRCLDTATWPGRDPCLTEIIWAGSRKRFLVPGQTGTNWRFFFNLVWLLFYLFSYLFTQWTKLWPHPWFSWQLLPCLFWALPRTLWRWENLSIGLPCTELFCVVDHLHGVPHPAPKPPGDLDGLWVSPPPLSPFSLRPVLLNLVPPRAPCPWKRPCGVSEVVPNFGAFESPYRWWPCCLSLKLGCCMWPLDEPPASLYLDDDILSLEALLIAPCGWWPCCPSLVLLCCHWPLNERPALL